MKKIKAVKIAVMALHTNATNKTPIYLDKSRITALEEVLEIIEHIENGSGEDGNK